MQKTENYFLLANLAAESAVKAQSPSSRQSWSNLAEEYRNIALWRLQRETEGLRNPS